MIFTALKAQKGNSCFRAPCMDSATDSQAARMECPEPMSSISLFAQVIAAILAYTPEPMPSQRIKMVLSTERSQSVTSPQRIFPVFSFCTALFSKYFTLQPQMMFIATLLPNINP